MNKPILLCTPGPTPIPELVQNEMSKPMIHHRSKEFEQIFSRVRSRLNEMVNNDGETLLFSSSGSGAMEASVGSLLRAGDHVVIIESGKFGERWAELANCYGLVADVIKVNWGNVVEVEQLQGVLRENTKAVLTQACETSTGVFHPIGKIGSLLREYPECLFIVDAITALGIHRIDMQSDGIDAVIGGSQKALMCPPGVGTLSLSQRALNQVGPSQTMYLSVEKELKSQIKNVSAFTPAVSIIRGLDVALDMIFAESLEQVYKRHYDLALSTRKIFRNAGLPLFNKDQDASFGITVVGSNLGWDVNAWIENLKHQHGLWIAGGQEHLKGKVFRFAHMGWAHQDTVDQALKILLDSIRPYQSIPSWDELV